MAADSAKVVLVVEDSAVAREGLAAILRREGYDVTTASDGRVALDLLAAGLRPGVVLLDMLMPVLDGWRLLELLKGVPGGSPPVIVTTGTILTREWAESNGCAGFIKKPIEEEALLAELRRVLGE